MERKGRGEEEGEETAASHLSCPNFSVVTPFLSSLFLI